MVTDKDVEQCAVSYNNCNFWVALITECREFMRRVSDVQIFTLS